MRLALEVEQRRVGMLDSEQIIILIVAAAVVLLAAVLIMLRFRKGRMRHERLKERFGPEYDRVVAEKGMAGAESELRAREQRVKKQPLRDLTPADRDRFNADWEAIQARFVDEPSAAVQAADQL